MSPEAQRIAIARACGWTGFEPDTIQYTAKGVDGKWGLIPDYLNDLNAILGAVRSMTPVQKDEVVQRIGWSAVRQVLDHQYIADATARQWGAAYLKTLKLWKP